MTQVKDQYPWRLSLFIIAYYVTNSCYQGFIAKYYQDIGISPTQFTVLMAATPLVSIFMQPTWGMFGDRARSRNQILRVMTGIAAVFIVLYRLSDSFWWLLPISCLFAACYTSIQPMGDSIVLESLLGRNLPFGPIRLTGCLSFAVMSVVFGMIMQGRLEFTVYLTFLMLAVVFLATYSLPETRGHQSVGRKMNLTALLKQRELMGLFALVTMLQLTMGYFYSFYPIYFTALPGGTVDLLGWCFFIAAVFEVPFLLKADALFEKLGVGRLMVLSAVACTARWALLAATSNIFAAMAGQVLHGFGFIVITVSMAKYINHTVPGELKASGQMLLAVVGFGIARVFGILGGGLLAEAMGGINQGFWVMAGVSGLALCIFAPIYMRKPALNGR